MKLSSDGGEGELLMPSNVLTTAKATLRFVNPILFHDLVLPPGEFIGQAAVPMRYAARLKDANGNVVSGVEVKFTGGATDTYAVTNDMGVAMPAGAVTFLLPGLYNLYAEATLPSGNVGVELYIRIPPRENEEEQIVIQ
jgi:hypothetical protein